MKTTVRYSNVSYRDAIEDGRKVVYCDLDAEIRVKNVKNGKELFETLDVKSFVKKRLNAQGNVVVKCTGRAACSPEDTFDPVLGKRLAYTRAQRQAFIEAANIYAEAGRRFIRDLENTIDNCINSSVSCDFHTFELMYGSDEAESKFFEHRFKNYLTCTEETCECNEVID